MIFLGKKILFRLVLFFLVGLGITLQGCSHFNNNDTKQGKLVVSINWVRDSLAKPNAGFRKINRMTPLIYKDLVIFANALDGVVAYSQKAGHEVWRIAIPDGVEASGALINDRLFVGSNNGKVYSIDLVNVQILWTFDTKSEVVSEPLLADGVLYFLSSGQSIFAVDAVSGKQLWTYNRQDTANLMTVRGGSRPTISSGILYAGFSDGSLVSFNAKTGTQQSEITLNKNARFKDIDATPVVDGDNIYINSYDDRLYCVSKSKGEILWSAKGGGISTPLVIGDKVVYSSGLGELFAVSKADGHVIWKYQTENGILTDPLIYQGFIVVGESVGSLLLVDILTGKIMGSMEPGRGVFSKPSANMDLQSLYFISGEGNAYSVHAEISKKASIDYLVH